MKSAKGTSRNRDRLFTFGYYGALAISVSDLENPAGTLSLFTVRSVIVEIYRPRRSSTETDTATVKRTNRPRIKNTFSNDFRDDRVLDYTPGSVRRDVRPLNNTKRS